MANQLTRYATVASVDTAGEGYFYGYTVFDSGTKTTGFMAENVNDVFAFQFVLPFRAVVRAISFDLTTGINGSNSGLGIYGVDGNRLVHTGAISTAIADVAIIRTAVTAVTLEPAVYYFAQTSSATGVVARVFNTSSAAWLILEEGSPVVRVAKAGNASSAGVLPATLGTLTASAARNPVIAGFSP